MGLYSALKRYSVLLAFTDPYTSVGGGQTAIRNIIAQHPTIDFYFFVSGGQNHASPLPSNAHPVPLTDIYRSNAANWDFSGIGTEFPNLSLAGKERDLALMLDMAASVVGRRFDYVEAPDFHPLVAFLPFALDHVGVAYGKVVHSLHGALTLSINDLWDGKKPEGLAVLENYESLAYRAADIRYGISQYYVDLLSQREKMQGAVLDPLYAVDITNITYGEKYRRKSDQHDVELLCVARQDRIKGGDLFVEVAANIPPNLFKRARIVGDAVSIGKQSSTDALAQMASLRKLVLQIDGRLPHDQIMETFAADKVLNFVPSRVDTFNLVAFESILNGCPTVVSKAAGIHGYLETNMKGLPFISFDPDDVYGCLGAVIKALDNYDDFRSRIQQWFRDNPVRPSEADLRKVLSTPAQTDKAARRTLSMLFTQVAEQVRKRTTLPCVQAKIDDVLVEVRAGNATEHASLADYVPLILRNEVALMEGAEDVKDFERQSDEAQDRIIDKLAQLAEHNPSSRGSVYKRLAQLESLRGNKLLEATYLLRSMRVTGRVSATLLDRSMNLLEQTGHQQRVDDIRLCLTGSDADIERRLRDRLTPGRPFQTDGIAELRRLDTQSTPRVSLIVSVYNAASKIEQFARSLSHFNEGSRKITEVIFIDSNSTDGGYAAILLAIQVLHSVGMSAVAVRTNDRETIQHAWNRGLAVARGDYVAFLGVDEMVRPDAFEMLATYLDRNGSVDWAQGSAVVYDVNERGSFIRDVMRYNREMYSKNMHLLDVCYISYVGSIYRRSLHERVGLYDISYRGAGDTEFKNRSLPHMNVTTLPVTLGMFRNFPEERTTESPMAEIEDWCAWYLHRTSGGINYHFGEDGFSDAISLLRRCFNYRKTYRSDTCMDMDMAASIARYAMRHPMSDLATTRTGLAALRFQRAYQDLDTITPPNAALSMAGIYHVAHALKDFNAHRRIALSELTAVGINPATGMKSDNRYHQHFNRWKSVNQSPIGHALPQALSERDLAGCQDLAEVLSSCGSNNVAVDFESAWETGNLDQVRALFEEQSVDVAIVVLDGSVPAANLDAYWSAISRSIPGDRPSCVVVGAVDVPAFRPGSRVYHTGPVATIMPLLAAAKVVLLYPPEKPSSAKLRDIEKLLLLGKVVLVPEQTAKLCNKDFLKYGVVISQPSDTALTIARLLADPIGRMEIGAASQAANKSLRSTAGRTDDYATSGTIIEWTPYVAEINRKIRYLLEQSGVSNHEIGEIMDSLCDAGHKVYIKGTLSALFVDQSAPALSTKQLINKRIVTAGPAESLLAAAQSLFGLAFSQEQESATLIDASHPLVQYLASA